MHPERSSRLSQISLLHVGLMVLFASWALGGNVGWARSILGVAGCSGLAITAAAVFRRLHDGRSLRALHLLWPLLALNILVLASLFQPNLRPLQVDGHLVFVPKTGISGPSSALPGIAAKDLLLFDGLFIPCFNLLLTVQALRPLKNLLLLFSANAAILSILGSLQSFTKAGGIYFGAVHSPNPQFFASFIYRNHWGAFAVLMLTCCVGLLFCRRSHQGDGDTRHSPALVFLLFAAIVAATIPQAGSRACTALAMILISLAVLVSARRIFKTKPGPAASRLPSIILLGAVVLLAVTAVYFVAEDSIKTRTHESLVQISAMRTSGSWGDREQLYADTLRMARAKPWFGWGLGSFGTIFPLFNNLSLAPSSFPVYYVNAHSDWLQWLSEVGIIGTAALALLFAGPVFSIRRLREAPTPAKLLLAGCGLVVFYSLIEFPLANPAVQLCFWACLFVAVRWSQLETADRPA